MRCTVIGLSALLLTVACSDSGTGPGSVDLVLTVLSGNNQVGVQASALPEALVLQVTGSNGDPVAGARVLTTIGQGSGRLLVADSVTDAMGRATVYWELGEAWANTLVFSLLGYTGVMAEARAWGRYRHEAPEETADGWETAIPSTVTSTATETVTGNQYFLAFLPRKYSTVGFLAVSGSPLRQFRMSCASSPAEE